MKPYKKRIAPRLANGDKRDPIAHGLPPHIKRGLAMRAYRDRVSVSWMLERAILEWFRFEMPVYVVPKAEEKSTAAAVRHKQAG